MAFVIYNINTEEILKVIRCKKLEQLVYNPYIEDWVEIVSKDCDYWKKNREDREKKEIQRINNEKLFLFDKNDSDLQAFMSLDKTNLDAYLSQVVDLKEVIRMILKILINKRGL